VQVAPGFNYSAYMHVVVWFLLVGLALTLDCTVKKMASSCLIALLSPKVIVPCPEFVRHKLIRLVKAILQLIFKVIAIATATVT